MDEMMKYHFNLQTNNNGNYKKNAYPQSVLL